MAVSFPLVLLIRSSDRLLSLAPLAAGGVNTPPLQAANPTSSNNVGLGYIIVPFT